MVNIQYVTHDTVILVLVVTSRGNLHRHEDQNRHFQVDLIFLIPNKRKKNIDDFTWALHLLRIL